MVQIMVEVLVAKVEEVMVQHIQLVQVKRVQQIEVEAAVVVCLNLILKVLVVQVEREL